MIKQIKNYLHWLHLQWPAGLVEKLPLHEEGKTNIAGVWLSGDLTGIPLLKYSVDSGKKAIDSISSYLNQVQDSSISKETYDLIILGAGVSGLSAALEAESKGLNYKIFESNRPFYTIHDFPKGKPIFLYPKEYQVESKLALAGDTKEELLGNLVNGNEIQSIIKNKVHFKTVSNFRASNKIFEILDESGKTIASSKTVLIAIGKSGDFRKMGIPGEDLPKVFNRLHDPKEYADKRVAVVGGGDSALESAIALTKSNAKVSLIHRGDSFAKAKWENINEWEEMVAANQAEFYPNSQVREIKENSISIESKDGRSQVLKNDIVFSMIGRNPPLGFFRKSGIAIQGEWSVSRFATLAAVVLFCVGLYHWKMDGSWFSELFKSNGLFPFSLESWRAGFHPQQGILYILATNLVSPSFYYTLVYTSLIGIFGIRRVVKRPTPYIKRQTLTLFLFQFFPLFVIPFFMLPMMGHWGVWDSGIGSWIGNEFFPKVDYGLGREYWRAFGLILAWPLFIWNVFSGGPMWGWLAVSFIQTFVIIPIIVWRWGKGAYCGWVCSCGALAETLGDDHRKKMPHGPGWNKLNILGQVILLLAFILLIARIGSWFLPGVVAMPLNYFFNALLSGWFPLSYYYIVDVWLAGILGVGLYFHFSGRTWCRFACPLAALMHIYARFTEFRIFSDKKKCISCNVCTSVCHQGIDIMSFANKGLPMEDPECVRCSACVVNCPTDVLSFGRLEKDGQIVLDRVSARLG
ncbi:MAG: NAD(P)-binding domain-containing protein [Leptospira sp.]|nr:NAD(P)-binding domain-containing protein [Leptospira sp.]